MQAYDKESRKHTVLYDDGDSETIIMRKHKWHMESEDPKQQQQQQRSGSTAAAAAGGPAKAGAGSGGGGSAKKGQKAESAGVKPEGDSAAAAARGKKGAPAAAPAAAAAGIGGGVKSGLAVKPEKPPQPSAAAAGGKAGAGLASPTSRRKADLAAAAEAAAAAAAVAAAARAAAGDAYKPPASGIVGQRIKIWWPEVEGWVYGRVVVSRGANAEGGHSHGHPGRGCKSGNVGAVNVGAGRGLMRANKSRYFWPQYQGKDARCQHPLSPPPPPPPPASCAPQSYDSRFRKHTIKYDGLNSHKEGLSLRTQAPNKHEMLPEDAPSPP